MGRQCEEKNVLIFIVFILSLTLRNRLAIVVMHDVTSARGFVVCLSLSPPGSERENDMPTCPPIYDTVATVISPHADLYRRRTAARKYGVEMGLTGAVRRKRLMMYRF